MHNNQVFVPQLLELGEVAQNRTITFKDLTEIALNLIDPRTIGLTKLFLQFLLDFLCNGTIYHALGDITGTECNNHKITILLHLSHKEYRDEDESGALQVPLTKPNLFFAIKETSTARL